MRSSAPPGARADASGARPFAPDLRDLHDLRHPWLKAALLLLWALVSFGAGYFAHDLQALTLGGWSLGYWLLSQGALLAFIAIVLTYAWAMNRFERQDGLRPPPGADTDADRAHAPAQS